jgi:hypothetical protein
MRRIARESIRMGLVIAASLSVAWAPAVVVAQAPGSSDQSAAQTTGGAVTTVAPLRGRSLDQERDPGGGPRPTEPVFLEPATVATEHFRAGLSSWITPGAPFDHREDPGGVAVGLTITWPVPHRGAEPAGPNAWHGTAAR